MRKGILWPLMYWLGISLSITRAAGRERDGSSFSTGNKTGKRCGAVARSSFDDGRWHKSPFDAGTYHDGQEDLDADAAVARLKELQSLTLWHPPSKRRAVAAVKRRCCL